MPKRKPLKPFHPVPDTEVQAVDPLAVATAFLERLVQRMREKNREYQSKVDALANFTSGRFVTHKHLTPVQYALVLTEKQDAAAIEAAFTYADDPVKLQTVLDERLGDGIVYRALIMALATLRR